MRIQYLLTVEGIAFAHWLQYSEHRGTNKAKLIAQGILDGG
jgi:hypothetical protein